MPGVTYKHWPSGKLQDYAILLFNSSDLLSLYEYSKRTDLEVIWWCESGIINGFNKDGRPLTENEISKDQDVQGFISYAASSSLPCYFAMKGVNHWLIRASSDGGRTELNGMSALSQIARFYIHSNSPIETGCKESGDSESKLMSCIDPMFSNWYMLEETLTYKFEDLSANDI